MSIEDEDWLPGIRRAANRAAHVAPLPEPTDRLSKESAALIFDTLQWYANVSTYQGERTGGVLQGCPRGPAPYPRELVEEARRTLSKVEAELRACAIAAPVAQPSPNLRLALERTLGNFRLLLAGKPVRDASETIAEAERAIKEDGAAIEPRNPFEPMMPGCNRVTNSPCEWSKTPPIDDTCKACGFQFPEWV